MKVAVDTIGPQGLPIMVPDDRSAWLATTLADAGALRAPAGANVRLMLLRTGEQVQVRGNVTLALEGPCSRCANDMAFALDTAVDVALVPLQNQPKALDNGEIRAQDIDLGAYVDGSVDLGSILHDEILLDMPSQVLCREDCLGRCGSCGQNRNEHPCDCDDGIDPMGPFASLAKLKTI